MKVINAIAEILKREGVEYLIGYPVNPIIEAAAEAGIRTIMVRQERIGAAHGDAVASHLGRQDRRLCHAARAGHRERVWRRRAGLWRIRAAGRDAGRPCRATSSRCSRIFNAALISATSPNRSSRSPCRRTVEAMRRAFTHGQERPPRPGAGRVPDRILREEIPDPLVSIREDAAAEARPRPAIGVASSPRRWSPPSGR